MLACSPRVWEVVGLRLVPIFGGYIRTSQDMRLLCVELGSCGLILKNPVFDVIIGCRMRNVRASASKLHTVHVHTLNKVCAM